MKLKEYIAKQMIGKTLHFHCDCTAHIDVVGTIRDFELKGNEVVYIVDTGERIIRIGENHPNMYVN